MASGNDQGSMYLIDAHSLIFQVFHAIPAMTSPKGLPTNALFGFTRDVLFLRTEKKPEYLLCVFDVAGPTFRDRLYPEYKAHRAPMPDDLQPQIPLIYQLLEAMRVPILGQPGFEADDVIATVATAASQRGLNVFICTSDKDCRQLIDDRVSLYNLRKKEVLDREALFRDWEIKPEQVIDLQAMVGDSVDNVPGVPGIGLKTAAKLLQDFGTLENILANIERIPGAKRQENLRASQEMIRLSRTLVRLDTEVPMTMDWEGWRVRSPDVKQLLKLFQEWNFNRFADIIRTEFKEEKVSSREGAAAVKQRDLFADAANGAAGVHEIRSNLQGEYHLLDTPESFEGFLKELGQQRRIAVDLETMSPSPRQAEIVGYAFSWKEGEAWYLPVAGPESGKRLDPQQTLAKLRPILEDPGVTKVNQNIKYDQIVLRQKGIRLSGLAGDCMVADYLLHAGERSHNLGDLASRYLNHQLIPIADLIGKGGQQASLDQVSTARVSEYAGEDADAAWRLCGLLEGQLTEQGLDKLYRNLEIPLIEVLADMEFNGVRLDVPLLEKLSREMANQLSSIENEIYGLAGRQFNIASPKQLRDVLFDDLKLPRQRRTGITGEASTDQETLERLAALGHALPTKILEHRQIAKLKGTYVDALPALVTPATNRIHASFNQTVAATGRLSSSDPNLQNIPVRTEQGRQIRQAFIPEAGWQILTADYSQIELRMLAHFCGDAELRRAFAEDRDVHARVASQIYGVLESDVTADMRRTAKVVNFGVIYGMSAFGLSERLGIPKEESAAFIDAYFGRYSKVAEYQSCLLEKCLRDGYVSTILGRRREITGIRRDSKYQQRNQPEREAINMEIQGSAADLIKTAMLNIFRRLREMKFKARMLMQIHDELVFEAPPDELQEVAKLVSHEMTTAIKLEVPLKVDIAAGPNWLDVEEIHF
jgi:DNA polymerase-1